MNAFSFRFLFVCVAVRPVPGILWLRSAFRYDHKRICRVYNFLIFVFLSMAGSNEENAYFYPLLRNS